MSISVVIGFEHPAADRTYVESNGGATAAPHAECMRKREGVGAPAQEASNANGSGMLHASCESPANHRMHGTVTLP